MFLNMENFGKWTVICENGRSSGGNILYKCQCACGTVSTIIKNKSKQCRSCASLEKYEEKNILGSRFGKWTVEEKIKDDVLGKWIYRCTCDCGKKLNILRKDLVSKKTTQCLSCSLTSHGMSKTNEFRIWQGMKERCANERHLLYKYYGSRGIKVCERWLKFENFYEDMGKRPEKQSIDRINNDGNYELSNCRWATASQQNSNRRTLKVRF